MLPLLLALGEGYQALATSIISAAAPTVEPSRGEPAGTTTESDLLEGALGWVAVPASKPCAAVPASGQVYIWPGAHELPASWSPCLAWTYPHERNLVSLRVKPLPHQDAHPQHGPLLRLSMFNNVGVTTNQLAAVIDSFAIFTAERGTNASFAFQPSLFYKPGYPKVRQPVRIQRRL